MQIVRHKDIVLHTDGAVTKWGARRTLVIYCHGSYDKPQVGSEDEYQQAKTRVPSFTKLFYRTPFNDTVVHTECTRFLTGRVFENDLQDFGVAAGGDIIVDYNLSQGVGDNFDKIDNANNALLYDFATVKVGSRAKLSDVWEMLEQNSLRYAYVQGWFCRVIVDHKIRVNDNRSSDKKLIITKGDTSIWANVN